eukprot:TRINITY_DN4181_c0_g1_i1.p2 TRINITY_DN4181_c0_g1~~TRINITY_DN4181_c0_g1_i1.p2  ORF type:complete len:394 (-),score=205.98 TRINITY_DN4181_c0_g1_i1:32-1213(-)
MYLAIFLGAIKEILKKFQLENKIPALLGGLGNIVTADQDWELWELSQSIDEDRVLQFLNSGDFSNFSEKLENSKFLGKFENFILKYGWRSSHELEMSNLRWRENPTILFQTLASYVNSTFKLKKDVVEKNRREEKIQVENEIREKIPFLQKKMVLWAIPNLQQLSRLRENGKAAFVRVLGVERMCLLKLGKFLQVESQLQVEKMLQVENISQVENGLQADDIFHANFHDLCKFWKSEMTLDEFSAKIRGNKIQLEKWKRMSPPDVFLGTQPIYPIVDISSSDDRKILLGTGGSAGKFRGRSRVLRNVAEISRLDPMDILVTSTTDPSWTPLFLKCSGVVVERGGMLSHGAIVARELGIPAVVGVAGLFSQVEDGDILEIDGSLGTVEIISQSA